MSVQTKIRSAVDDVYRGFNHNCDDDAAYLSSPSVLSAATKNDFVRFSTRPEQGAGFWDVLRYQDGVLLCVAYGEYTDIVKYAVTPPENVITLRLIVSGDIELNRTDNRNYHFADGSISLLSVPRGVTHQFHIDSENPLSSVTMHFDISRFATLLGFDDDAPPGVLAPFFSDARQPQFQAFPLSRAMRKSATELIRSPFSGNLRRRYFEAKTLELMCLFFDAIQRSERGAVSAPARDFKNFRAFAHARQILEDHIADPPTVEQLAKLVGVNRTELRRGFKQLYGETISEFTISNRMKRAYDLLEQRAMNVGAVADALGYSHIASFSNAFHRYYGFSPTAVRRIEF